MKRVVCLLAIAANLLVVTPVFAHTFQDIIYIIFNGKKPPAMVEREKQWEAEQNQQKNVETEPVKETKEKQEKD